jgi:hypothetical protein
MTDSLQNVQNLFTVNCLWNMRYCCKQCSDIIRVKCDTGNVYLCLIAAAKFGDFYKITKGTPFLQTTSVRPSVLLSGT